MTTQTNEISCGKCGGLIAVGGLKISKEQQARLKKSNPKTPLKERLCLECEKK